jgi:hypothetical protein
MMFNSRRLRKTALLTWAARFKLGSVIALDAREGFLDFCFESLRDSGV